MKEYKPKRFEFIDHSKNGWNRSISISIARENYGLIKDYYINIFIWSYSITLVILRITVDKKDAR